MINMDFSHDQKLNDIAGRVTAEERLSFDDGVDLYSTTDLPALGKLRRYSARRDIGAGTWFKGHNETDGPARVGVR